MQAKIDDRCSMWHVEAYGIWSNKEDRWHRSVNIVAKTAEDAMDKLKKQHPGLRILSLNHKGKIDYD